PLARRGSAELYSAVSQISNLQGGLCNEGVGRGRTRPRREFGGKFGRTEAPGYPAECNSARQQIKNLRYEVLRYGLPLSEATDCDERGSRQALLHRQFSGKSQSFAFTGLYTT